MRNALEVASKIAMQLATNSFEPALFNFDDTSLPLSMVDSGFDPKFLFREGAFAPDHTFVTHHRFVLVCAKPIGFSTGLLARLAWMRKRMRGHYTKGGILVSAIKMDVVESRMWRCLGVPELLIPRKNYTPPKHKKKYGRTIDDAVDLL